MFYVVRLRSPTRVLSPRQLPTDHDCAVPTRGYQSDQPSQLPLLLSPDLPAKGRSRLPKTQSTARLNLTLDRVAPY